MTAQDEWIAVLNAAAEYGSLTGAICVFVPGSRDQLTPLQAKAEIKLMEAVHVYGQAMLKLSSSAPG